VSSGVSFPRDRLFGLGSGPKADVLAKLVEQLAEASTNSNG
jgi:hypothetical protein